MLCRLNLILVLLCTWAGLSAEVLQPVHWTSREEGDSVRLSATVDEGWHLTVIQIGDSMVGEEYADGCTLVFPIEDGKEIAVRYNACDDSQCTSPEVYYYVGEKSNNVAVLKRFSSGVELWYLFLMGFLGGLLAIFTPCIWPIIPMTVSFFLKRADATGKRSWSEAVLYGLSIILIYVGLGLLLTVFFGASTLNALSTSAPVNLFFFALLIVFALSFFGLFEITLPSSWSTALDGKARNTGGFLGILLMAFTLVIVSFSCTGPIIGTLLVEAAGRSLLAPAVGMLGFAAALALPFSLFALSPRMMQRLPRSGAWMQSFKVTLAFLELALSLKFLSVADMAYGWGILPRWLFVALWVMDFAALGIYLLHKSWVGKVLALAAFAFAAYLVPGLWGAPVKAIAAFAPPMPIEAQDVFFDYETGMQYARQENRPVLLQFSGYGCVNCRKMEQYILHDERVKEEMKRFVQIVLYVDSRQDLNGNGIPDGDEYSRLQQERFQSNAQPYWVALSSNGNQMGSPLAFTTDTSLFLRWLDEIRK